MRNIGIVTLFGYFNYGNRLQNYAMEYVLKEKSVIPVTLNYTKKKTVIKELGYTFVKRILAIIPSKRGVKSRRFLKFKKFNNNLLNVRNIYNLKKLDNMFDAFVCGSDQVWNPIDANDFYFLSFARDEKKYAVSASFGIVELPDKIISEYKKNIDSFKEISVREDSAKSIISKLCGRNVEVTFDPVFLLSADEWNEIVSVQHNAPFKYIVCYFLGEPNVKEREFISKLANDYGADVVDLYDENSLYYDCGPREFLYYIKNAELVFTDSFHATAFAIIFHKEFWVFERHDHETRMETRLVSLLDKLELSDRWYECYEPQKKCSYDSVDRIVEYERKRLSDYIGNIVKKVNELEI